MSQQTAIAEQEAAAARKALPIAARRQAARVMYTESVTAGMSMTALELGEAFGRSERWGRDRMTEVRQEFADLAETADPATAAAVADSVDRRSEETEIAETSESPSDTLRSETTDGESHADTVGRTRASRYGMGALLTVVGVLLAGVIVAPIALSSQDIIDWAGSTTGLGLTGSWPLVTFLALDAAAAVCVGLVVYCAWRGESAGLFAWLVWAFAGMSAYANYSHSNGSAAKDAAWFFPAMSIAGPFLLEIIVRRVRRWVQEGTGQRDRHSVSFGFARWLPGIGALRETYGAWRLARLDGIADARQAVLAYRRLCPSGSIRVLKALRDQRTAK